MEDKGYDASELIAAITALEPMVAEYEVLYADFVEILSLVVSYPCSDTEDGIRGLVRDAQQALKMVKEQRREIREFYRTEIRPVIKDIRFQNRVINDENEVEEEENDE